VPKHHSFLSIYHPPVSCRLIIATTFPSYWTSMDTHISLWLGYMMHYSFYGLYVMCCTYPSTIDFMFCIWLLFYTHYFCYSFIFYFIHATYCGWSWINRNEHTLNRSLSTPNGSYCFVALYYSATFKEEFYMIVRSLFLWFIGGIDFITFQSSHIL